MIAFKNLVLRPANLSQRLVGSHGSSGHLAPLRRMSIRFNTTSAEAPPQTVVVTSKKKTAISKDGFFALGLSLVCFSLSFQLVSMKTQRDALREETTRMQSEINRLEGYLRKHGINILEEVEERKSGRERDPSKGNEKPRKGGFSL